MAAPALGDHRRSCPIWPAPAQPYIEEALGDCYEETNSIGPKAVPLMLEAQSVLLRYETKRARAAD